MVNEKNPESTIIDDIHEQTDLVINQIDKEITEMKEDQINFYKEGLQKQVDTYREKELNELELLSATEASQDKLDSKRQLLDLRQKCVTELFEKVQKDLQDFTQTEGYVNYLKKKLALIPEGKLDGVFKVREVELPLFQKLLKDEGIQAEAIRGRILIGGFRYKDKVNGFEYDFTLDAAMKDALSWFQSNSGFTID